MIISIRQKLIDKYGINFTKYMILILKNIINIQKHIRGFIYRKKYVIRLLKEKTNWIKLIELYNIFGESLNTNDMKFLKGKLYEYFVSSSNKIFVHVDQIGYDIIYKGIKIEIKFSQEMLLTKKRNLKKTIKFRCKNSNGSKKMTLNNTNTAHIYILIQRDAISYTTGYTVIKYLSGDGDLDAKIPNEHVNILWKSDDNINIKKIGDLDISNIISRIYNCVCNAIWKNIDWKKDLKPCLIKIANNL